MQREVFTTNVYDRNARAAAAVLINIGGARSSKSYSIAQLIVQRFWNEKRKKILVTRKTGPALTATAYKLVIEILREYGFYEFVRHNKTDREITNPFNGSFIAFRSVDDPEKIKSTEWNYIWAEEASDFDWDDWIVFRTRMSGPTVPGQPNQIILSLNPTDELGWINQRLILNPKFSRECKVIWSTYRDNPTLSKEYIRILEGLKDEDATYYQIYAKGKWGILKDIIYATYELLDELPKTFDEIIYGLDFGFNVQSALDRIGLKDGKNAYHEEKIYQTGLTNTDLIARAEDVIPPEERACPIYADAAEPDRIAEFERAGFNIFPADKSVKDGIDFCKRLKHYTTAANVNLNKERGSYKWRTDRNGNVLDEPVKFMDHLMDAQRYALYTHHKGRFDQPGIYA